jgi:uncharacterized glyoxalase superfamily protein PhnB
METSVIFSFSEIDYSITNPKAAITYDNSAPFSFIEFLKYTSSTYTPNVYDKFYQEYLKTWYSTQNQTAVTETDFIATQYVDLLKQLTLTYSTKDEQRFLSNIDFNDPEDLEIVIPFYTRKLKEIIIFYKDRRDKLKFVIDKNKRKTTNLSIELAIKENIIDYLFDNASFYTLNYSNSALANNVEIEVEELVDTFGAYLNAAPTPSSYGGDLRQQYYTANRNDIDGDNILSINDYLANTLFRNTFLKELGVAFTVNVNLTYDPVCSPNNPIGKFIDEKTKNGVTPADKQSLQTRLLEKYIGVDYYYIQRTSDNEILSGKLLTARNPSGNLVNVKNASVAAIPSDQLTSLKKIGLFFNEDHQGVLRFDSSKSYYTINSDLIQSGQTVVYPDPAIYGDTFYYQNLPLVFYVDNTVNAKNISTSFTTGDPSVTYRDQPFYAYYSKQQTYSESPDSLQDDFKRLYNQGYTQGWKEDIYGNEYGMFKDPFGQYFNGIQQQNENYVKLLPLNGFTFNFNISSDLTGYPPTLTNSKLTLSGGTFTGLDSVPDYYFNFRLFQPYQDIPAKYNLYPLSGASATLLNQVPLTQATTVLSTITGTNNYLDIKTKVLLEGGVYVKNIITNEILPLSTALQPIFNKYPAAVRNDIYNGITTFDIIYNVIILDSPNYVVAEKIEFDSTGFITPKTSNNYIAIDSINPLAKNSNKFFIPKTNDIFFYITRTYDQFTNDSSKIIYPEIYKYNINEGLLIKIFPQTNTYITNISSNFTLFNVISSLNIVEIDTPKLTYNSSNNLFVANYIGKDSNKSPYLYDIQFKLIADQVQIESCKVFDIHTTKATSNFYCASSSNVSSTIPALSSSVYNFYNLNFTFFNTVSNYSVLNNMEGYFQF